MVDVELLCLFHDSFLFSSDHFKASKGAAAHRESDAMCQHVIDCQSTLLLDNVQASGHDMGQGFIIHGWSFEDLKELVPLPTSLLLCLSDTHRQRFAGYQVPSPRNCHQINVLSKEIQSSRHMHCGAHLTTEQRRISSLQTEKWISTHRSLEGGYWRKD